ncbi:MAG: long-chain fatty acid--CoA ligase [Bacteroidetes bacterium]|nr:long-chain fatty acid--CoA ligase [Bacteroidota bacterium]
MSRILTAPPRSGTPALGITLPETLYQSLERHPNPALLNQPLHGQGFTAWSSGDVARAAEEIAFGLIGHGYARGEKVALFLDSDVYFALADMGALLGGFVDVPIYFTSTPESIHYVLDHAEARVLFVAHREAYDRAQPVLGGTKVNLVVVATGPLPLHENAASSYAVITLDQLRAEGRAARTDEGVLALRRHIQPSDVATILYTSGTTGTPKGVVLTHENISFNGLTSYSGIPDLRRGPGGETVLAFLPLTHIFARSGHYGALHYGMSVYFCSPDEVASRLVEVRPTLFMTVPRVLEKVHARIKQKGAELTGLKRRLMDWALGLAEGYSVDDKPMHPSHGTAHRLADRLVFSKWREALGGRARYLIVGGAALSADLTNFFSAAGLNVLQGYGLTETSPVITFNRPGRNHAGTVGEPLPDVEVMLADDGEILTRGPHVMQAYYKNPVATAEVLSNDGWFATGDIGEITPDGWLRITDRKKDLFKLSTGKYVMPQPVEIALAASPLIEHAVVVGAGQKFATALLFPDDAALKAMAAQLGASPTATVAELCALPAVLERVQTLVDEANAGMEHWSTVKRFTLVPDHLSLENGTLTPKLSVRRHIVRQTYADEIAAMYDGEEIGAELSAALKARHAGE